MVNAGVKRVERRARSASIKLEERWNFICGLFMRSGCFVCFVSKVGLRVFYFRAFGGEL